MSGEAELYYGILITGVCVPPFVHYALKFIRKGLPGARQDIATMRAAARADLERTKEILRTKEKTLGSLEEVEMNENQSQKDL